MNKDEMLYEGDWYDEFSSSNIFAWKYAYDEQRLTVEFLSGSQYDYYRVPPDVVEDWYDAGSKGKFHHRYIKWDYTYRKK